MILYETCPRCNGYGGVRYSGFGWRKNVTQLVVCPCCNGEGELPEASAAAYREWRDQPIGRV